jgi:dTDP-glucose 4,6-dehydratase/UDP-glucose 4-epimerase
MRKKNYLVTGGAGFLGRAWVRSLLDRGHEVRVLDNGWRGRLDMVPRSAAAACELVDADIRDAEAVRRACRGIDAVSHFAFVNGTEHFYARPDLVLDVGVKGMVNLLDGCREEGVRELLLISSSEVYQSPPRLPTDEAVPLIVPDPLNPRYSYGGGKIISELMAIHCGSTHFERVLIVRPHNV